MKDGKLYRLTEVTEEAGKKYCADNGHVFPEVKTA